MAPPPTGHPGQRHPSLTVAMLWLDRDVVARPVGVDRDVVVGRCVVNAVVPVDVADRVG